MKSLGRIAALLGFATAIALVWHEHPRAVLSLLRAAGPGLVLAGLVHVLPMLANAKDWQTLILGSRRPSLRAMLHLVWIRESINSALPVARIGGEIVSYRLLGRQGLAAPIAAASLVADMQLTLISQLLFTLVGIGFLLGHSTSAALRLAGDLSWGVVALIPVLGLFAMVQHARPFERMTHLLNRVTSGKLTALVGGSAEIDEAIKQIWRRRRVVIQYVLFWQTLQNLATSLEIWLALHFLGSPVTLVEAFVIESLIQAVSSAAFVVPGGLGVQEGAFIMIGRAFGLSAPTSLALAGARRIRDLLIFIPGLVAWQVAEAADKAPASAPGAESP